MRIGYACALFPDGGDPIKFFRLLALLMLIPAAASAQPVAVSAYLKNLQDGVDNGVYRELAVGWIDGTLVGPGQRQTWFLGHGLKPDADTRFELGAASEIFTGLALAQSAIDGKLRLDTPVRDLLPAGFVFADPAVGAMRLRRLALHGSGLPAQPPNLFPANPADSFADYSDSDLLAFLANYRQSDSARQTPYSVIDAGLLGYLIGRAYDQRFAVVLVSAILDRLGMRHTGFGDATNLLQGYRHGLPVPHWHFGTLAGAAGLRSSLGDLLQFLQFNLTPEHSPLRAALLLARQPQGDDVQSPALGWKTVAVDADGQSWPLVWRASRTAGFSVFLGFRSDRQQALVLLGNTDADLSALGIAWLEDLAPPPLPPVPSPAAMPMNLAAYPGLYALPTGGELVVGTDSTGLTAQFVGHFPMALHPNGSDTFATADGTVVVTFQREANLVNAAMVEQGGVNVLAQRLSERAPQIPRAPQSVDVKTLLAYAGDYRIDPDYLLRVSVNADALSMQPTGQAPMALIAFAPNRFADAHGCCELHFLRNDAGAVDRVKIALAGAERIATRVQWRNPR